MSALLSSSIYASDAYSTQQQDIIEINNPSCSEFLSTLNLEPDNDYVLNVDIDCSSDVFTPIASASSPFSGSLNGNGHTISGIKYTTNDPNVNTGLFASLRSAHIENLRIEDVNFEGGRDTAILAGFARDTTIENVNVSGQIRGEENLGGLLGRAFDNDIINSYADVDITAVYSVGNPTAGGLIGEVINGLTDNEQTNIISSHAKFKLTLENKGGTSFTVVQGFGGLVGSAEGNLTIDMSSADVDINKDPDPVVNVRSAGGLIGHVYRFRDSKRSTVLINRSFSKGLVRGVGLVGGLVGGVEENVDLLITSSYSQAAVMADDVIFITPNAGGLVGALTVPLILPIDEYPTITIQQSYASGLVEQEVNSSRTDVTSGGLIGNGLLSPELINLIQRIDVMDSYWDIETTGQLTSVSSQGLEDVSGANRTRAMLNQDSYPFWSFTATWTSPSIEAGYPRLQWEDQNQD